VKAAKTVYVKLK